MSVVTATILSQGRPIDSVYELLAIDVRREANRIPSASLLLHDGDAAERNFPLSNRAYFEPGAEVEIKARWEMDSRDATLFKGRVVRHVVEASAQGSVLRVELKDAAVRLTQTRKSMVFRDQSDDQVIRKLVQGAGLRPGKIDATKVKHRELVQYYCSDWDFILSRADCNSLVAVVEDGMVSVRKVEVAGAPKHQFEYGLAEIYDLEFEADASSQYPSVRSRGWSLKDQKATESSAKPFRLSQGNLDGKKLAQSVGFAEYSLSHPVPVTVDELQAWADARLIRSRMSMLRGRLSTIGLPDIELLEVVKVAGLGDRFNGKVLVTGFSHRLNDGTWRTDIQFGLSPRSFFLEDGIRDAPAAGLLPAVNGLQIGIVNGFEEDPAKEMRVKIMLPGMGSEAGTLWARLAALDAGKNRGVFFFPEPGDEVVVGFFNEDPRQPVILGGLYSSKNGAPSDLAPPTKDNLKKGIVTKGGTKIVWTDDKKPSVSIETKGKQRIFLDDDSEVLELSDKHGNKITMAKDGIKVASAKDLNLEASGNVVIKGAKVDVK
jgi:Rhs element Vgr protein